MFILSLLLRPEYAWILSRGALLLSLFMLGWTQHVIAMDETPYEIQKAFDSREPHKKAQMIRDILDNGDLSLLKTIRTELRENVNDYNLKSTQENKLDYLDSILFQVVSGRASLVDFSDEEQDDNHDIVKEEKDRDKELYEEDQPFAHVCTSNCEHKNKDEHGATDLSQDISNIIFSQYFDAESEDHDEQGSHEEEQNQSSITNQSEDLQEQDDSEDEEDDQAHQNDITHENDLSLDIGNTTIENSFIANALAGSSTKKWNTRELKELILIEDRRQINRTMFEGNTQLHDAVKQGKYSMVCCILNNNHLDINKRNRDGYTALQLAVMNKRHSDNRTRVLEALLNDGRLNIEKTDRTEGATALHFAVQYGNIGAISQLLDHGADIEAIDADEGNVFCHAFYAQEGQGVSKWDCESTIIFLIKKFKFTNPSYLQWRYQGNNGKLLHWAASENYTRVMQYILRHNLIDQLELDSLGDSALTLALKYYHKDAVDLLIGSRPAACDFQIWKQHILRSYHWAKKNYYWVKRYFAGCAPNKLYIGRDLTDFFSCHLKRSEKYKQIKLQDDFFCLIGGALSRVNKMIKYSS